MIVIMLNDFFDYLANIPSHRRLIAAGLEIFSTDDEVERFYVVIRGLVHLQRVQEDGAAVILQRASEGMILAEASVFSDNYHCSAIAINDSVLEVFPMEAVQNKLRDEAGIALAFSRHLASQVRMARKRAEILALKTVRERLSAWLAWSGGVSPARGEWHHVANEIGTSREALYRELSRRRKHRG